MFSLVLFGDYGVERKEAGADVDRVNRIARYYLHRVQLAEGRAHKETGRGGCVWPLPVEILVSGCYFASPSACTTTLSSSIFFSAFIPSNLRCSSSRTVILITLLSLNSPFRRLSESGSSM